DLGTDFGHSVTAAELDWAKANEWVMTGDDFLWRRTRLGLVMSKAEAVAIDSYIRRDADSAPRPAASGG
ncbi:MAG: glycerol-3-phosphate dehydrogenase, partial [Pseudomonadota bacterium]|nr:glycerol-3-phosphate dehydrogenase [Pseudomonadota bacterium]